MVETAMEEDRRCSWPMKAFWRRRKISKPSLPAMVKAQRVMEELSHEIPQYDLDKLFLGIRDGSHQETVSFENFIVRRYAQVIDELLEARATVVAIQELLREKL